MDPDRIQNPNTYLESPCWLLYFQRLWQFLPDIWGKILAKYFWLLNGPRVHMYLCEKFFYFLRHMNADSKSGLPVSGYIFWAILAIIAQDLRL